MYFIGVSIFLVLLIAVTFTGTSAMVFVDLPSFLLILAVSIPMLLASGLLPDFLKGFKLMGQKVNYYSAIDLKRILEANNLAVKTFLLSGGLGLILGAVAILSKLGDISKIGPYLALSLLTIFYALIFTCLILPIRARVKTILNTME
jgi:flagellar motor component MotA